MKRTKEIREVNDKRWKDLRDINKELGYDGMDGNVDDFAKAVKARAECAKMASGEESDINKLIRDYCTKHDIAVLNTYSRLLTSNENFYKEYKDRIHRGEGFIAYNPPSIRNTITKIISDYTSCRARVDILEERIKSIFDKYKTKFTVDDYVIDGDSSTRFMLDCIGSWIDSPAKSRGKTRAEIENYKLKLKDYILRDINEHGYRYNGLETKSIEEIVDWIITMVTSNHSFIVLKDIYTTVASPAERFRYKDCDGPTVDRMKDYILRRFEGLHANTEYCLKKMSELDGCKNDLKILEEQQEFLSKQNMELSCKLCVKDDEISRLKGLINAMNEEVKDM